MAIRCDSPHSSPKDPMRYEEMAELGKQALLFAEFLIHEGNKGMPLEPSEVQMTKNTAQNMLYFHKHRK